MPQKLLVIGNGFDLHQHLKSSFEEFFLSDDVYKYSNIFKEEYRDKVHNQMYKSNFVGLIDLLNSNLLYEYKSTEAFISYHTEYLLYSVEIQNPKKLIPGDMPCKLIEAKANFWALYFDYLQYFPMFTNGNDVFKDKHERKENDVYSLKNWSDIEYQIQYLLAHTENTLNKYVKSINMEDNRVDLRKVKICVSQYEDSMLNNGKFTFDGAISFITIVSALKSGWNPRRKNIYDYLFNQLQEFEKIFGNYLRREVKCAKKHKEYIKKSQEFAQKLADNKSYSLLNFNYTTFYDTNDSSKTNIHSTLKKDGHPIFGISSDLGNNELIYQKPYYRFSKAYRIMKLTNDNSIKNILPKDTDEIIFYGQSLSHADYLYFHTIFNEYKIYDSDSNVKLTFKYSHFHTTANIEQQQINNVYELINQYAKHIGMYNLLTKLLLENQLNIEEVK